MRVCCLCSGLGERMKPLSDKIPKSLIPVTTSTYELTPNLYNSLDVITNMFSDKISEIYIVSYKKYFDNINITEINNIKINYVISPYDPHLYNNQSSVKAFADYLGLQRRSDEDVLFIEGDIYLTRDFINYKNQVNFNSSNYFCRYRTNEWVFINRLGNSYYDVIKGSDGLAMSGVSIVNSKDLETLYNELSNSSSNDFWDSALVRCKLKDLNLIDAGSSIIEFDNIKDLIDNRLLSEEDVARLLSDDGNITKTSSMTNNSFIINYNEEPKVIRFSGEGTDKFINRTRERIFTREAYKLSPNTEFMCDGYIKISDYIDNCRTMSSSDKDIEIVIRMLNELHSRKGHDQLLIDLIKEVNDYMSIAFKSNRVSLPVPVDEFRDICSIFTKFITKHQHEDLVLCHRDLDPRNVLIASDSNYLIDFEYSGYLNEYWDWGALISEQELHFNNTDYHHLSDIISINRNSEIAFDNLKLLQWSAVVDYVWCMWTFAKISLGEDYEEYLNMRWKRACRIVKETDMT